MADRSRELAASGSQQAIDALRGKQATTISMQHLLGFDNRICPVTDFSALSRVEGLTGIDDLPTECLAAFARTAKLPALRAIGVICGGDTTIDLEKLLGYPALEAVRFVFGCPAGAAGLAPLARLPRLRMLIDADGGSIAGLDALPGLTDLVVVSPQEGAPPALAKMRALRTLAITLYQPVNLSSLGGLSALEELDISPQAGAPVDVAPLAKLTGLRRLGLRAEALAHGAALGKLANLCALDLSEAQTGVDLRALGDLRRLQTLRINVKKGRSLTPLARFEALETLELWSGCARPTIDLAPVAKLSRLSHVILDGAMKTVNGAPLAGKIDHTEPVGCREHRR